jgi:hypothetical protein
LPYNILYQIILLKEFSVMIAVAVVIAANDADTIITAIRTAAFE